MSMRDYAVSDFGLVLDEETIKVIASKVFVDFSDDEEEDWGYALYDMGICEHISEFTGEAQEITDNGAFVWGGDYKTYSNDSINYVPISRFPTLFKKAYNNMEEIIDEFKTKLGMYLTEDFDYRSRICHISGTYYG